MSGLEIAFYIVGIIFMGFSLILAAGLLIAALAIRMKLHSLEESLKQKIDVAGTVLAVLGTFSPAFRMLRRLIKIRRML